MLWQVVVHIYLALWVKKQQESLLPQRDRATRCVSQKLVIVETSCTTNQQQIEVIELESYSRSTCSKQPRLVDCRIGVVFFSVF